MGGFGSGRKATEQTGRLEDLPRLRLAHLRAAGLLLPGAGGMISVDHPHPHGRHVLWVECSPGHLALRFMWPGRTDARPLQQKIEVEERPCNFGGIRHYLTCPGRPEASCGRRTVDLHLTINGFVCRCCSGTIYTSQAISAPHLKATARIASIHARMGLSPGSGFRTLLPDRPKRMRFSTYLRLADALLEAGYDQERYFANHRAKVFRVIETWPSQTAVDPPRGK